MSTVVYNGAKERMGEGGFDPVNQTVHILLLQALTTTPDDPDHEFIADIVADEHADASYGRQVAGTKTGTRNNTNDRWEFDLADPIFPSLSGSDALMAVMAVIVTDDSDSWLISCHDHADTSPDGTDFTLVVGTSGALHIA